MKKVLLLIALAATLSTQAQEVLRYRSNGHDLEFKISQKRYYVEYELRDKAKVYGLQSYHPSKVTDSSALVDFNSPQSNSPARITEIKKSSGGLFKKVEPVLIYQDGIEQVCYGELNIRMVSGNGIEALFKNYKHQVIRNKFVKDLYLVRLTHATTEELFKLVNQLQTNPSVVYAEPNFYRFLKPHTTDPYFSSQWAIDNQGFAGGTVNADMNVDGAWNFVTGTGIKVAVIDEGVDLNHPDLTGNLLSGYDATGNGSNGAPNASTDDGHGTSCAGIIGAAANNSIGIAGIAYNAQIIPVRVAYSNGYPLGSQLRGWVYADSWIADGITWAFQQGADVLSNSWGGGSPSNTITYAIDDAVNNGRNGKGCVVLFSSGNYNTSVAYPATLTNVIAVGASSMCDERKSPTSCDSEGWGSNYGTNLDVIAPGVQIYTTDLSGTDGYSFGDYFSSFNGTSSACPNVAGVMALILSANPNLTQQQAREILEGTCDKVGGYTYQASVSGQPNGTWSSDAGYGRVNACAAVRTALAGTMTISGSTSLCTSDNTYTLNNMPAGATVSWSIDGFCANVLSSTGNQVTVTRIDRGRFKVVATISTACGDIQIESAEVTAGLPYIVSNVEVSSNGLGGDYGILCNHEYDYDDYVNTFTYTLDEAPAYPLTLNYFILDPVYGGIYGHAVTITNQSGTFTLPESLPDGFYNLEVWVSGGSCNEATDWFEVTMEYANCDPYARMVAYPNPASTELTITYDSDSKKVTGKQTLKEFSVRLLDKKGNILKEAKNLENTDAIILPVSDLPNGVYYLHIKQGKAVTRQQVIVQH